MSPRWRIALSPRWLAMHAFTILVFLVCLRLAWWQVSRLENGGGLQNIAYAMQWPVFGFFGVVIWWKSLAIALRPPTSPEVQTSPILGAPDDPVPAATPVEDPELAAYNRYLATLHDLESAQ